MSNNLIWKILKARLKLWFKKQVKRVWNFLSKKRYVGKYPRIKKWLNITAWIIVDCYIVFTAFDYNVKEVYIVENVQAKSVGSSVQANSSAEVLDTINGTVERNDTELSVSAPLTVEDKICEVFPENCKLMIAISKAESGMNPKAIGTKNTNGSIDCGLFQINVPSGVCPAELLEIDYNLKIARKKFDTQGLGAWYAWRDNKHLKFLES